MATFEGKPPPPKNSIYIVSNSLDLKVILRSLNNVSIKGISTEVGEFVDYLENAFKEKDYGALPGCLITGNAVKGNTHYSTAIIEIVGLYRDENWRPNIIAISETGKVDEETREDLTNSLGLYFSHFLSKGEQGAVRISDIISAIKRGPEAGVGPTSMAERPASVVDKSKNRIEEEYGEVFEEIPEEEEEDVPLLTDNKPPSLKEKLMDIESAERTETDISTSDEGQKSMEDILSEIEGEERPSRVGAKETEVEEDLLEIEHLEEDEQGDSDLSELRELMNNHEMTFTEKPVKEPEVEKEYMETEESKAEIDSENDKIELADYFEDIEEKKDKKTPKDKHKVGMWMSKKTDTTEIITIGSAKRGVGVSTIASNAAIYLSRKAGARVCVIEYSKFSTTYPTMLDMIKAPTIIDSPIIEDPNKAIDSSNYRDFVNEHVSGVGFVFAPQGYGEGDVLTTKHYNKIIRGLSPMYDVMILDVSGDVRDTDDIWPYRNAHKVILVVEPTRDSAYKTQLFISMLERAVEVNPKKIGIIINKMPDETSLDDDYFQRALRAFDVGSKSPSDKPHRIIGKIPENYPFTLNKFNSKEIMMMSDKGNPITNEIMSATQNMCPSLFSDVESSKKAKSNLMKTPTSKKKKEAGGEITKGVVNVFKRLKGD